MLRGDPATSEELIREALRPYEGLLRTKGPHSITLLAHANAGVTHARAVVNYLKSIVGADDGPVSQPLSDADVSRLIGTYAFGVTPVDRIEISASGTTLQLARAGHFGRGLFHFGGLEFYPGTRSIFRGLSYIVVRSRSSRECWRSTMATQPIPAKVPYRVKAESVEACNCQHGCNCQFAGYPNEGKCEFIVGFEVKDGRFGDVSLNGLRAVVAAKYPKAIHEGNGHVVLFIDDKATGAQVDAFATILSGKMGGMPWEALAGTIGRFEGPIRKPIDIKAAGERSHVRVPGAIELQLTPFRDIISGAEKEVHIVYPKGGFFWNDAKVATTDTMHARHGDLSFEWPKRYAAAAEVNWTNQ